MTDSIIFQSQHHEQNDNQPQYVYYVHETPNFWQYITQTDYHTKTVFELVTMFDRR